jgi:hypothetical protein
MEELRKTRKRLAADYEKLSAELTRSRAAAARRLEKRVEAELAELAMDRTVFRVSIEPAAWSPMAPTRWNSWFRPTAAKSRARWKKSPPAAKSPALRWR